MAEFNPNVNVPVRLDTVPSAHSRSLASVRFLPQTRTPLRVGAKCGRPHRGSNRALTTGTSVGWLEIDKHYSLELCFSIEKQLETVSGGGCLAIW